MSELRKSITHLITTLGYGGAERQLLTITKEQAVNGWNVTIVFLKRPSPLVTDFKENGCRVLTFWMWISQILKDGIRQFRNDTPLVHAHLPRSELVALVLFKVARIPYLVSRHNAEPFFPHGPKFISRFLSNLVIKNSRAVVAISIAVQDFLVKSKEIPRNQIRKMRVVYYGISLRNKKTTLLNSKKYNSLTVGTIGRLVPQKDTATLLKAIWYFNQKHTGKPSFNAKIVGSGILKSDLEGLVQNLDIRPQVEWIDSLDNVSCFFRDIDVFVLPSLYEGFGMVLLEAMREQVPVLATRTTSIPEVMGSEYEGLFEVGNYVELTRKLEKCIDPTFRINLTSSYESRLSNFSSEKSYRELSMLYRKIFLEEVT